LFKDRHIEVIPYCLDLTRYKPVKQEIARELLGLPHDKKLILFGANQAMQDPRKGFHYLQSALQNLSREGWQEKAELLVFGEAQISKPPETGLKTRVLGWLHDDVSLSLAYAAADVYVCPSLQDNLPNAVIEASACGTPTLAFQIGGLPDLIEHLQTGFLARPFESDDLARGLHYLLSDEQTRKAMGLAARAKAEREFEPFRVAGQYAKLFEDTLRAV
jgi:glycosyltransferase involved in cell wall biosynthesis